MSTENCKKELYTDINIKSILLVLNIELNL